MPKKFKHFLIITEYEGEVEARVFKAETYDKVMEKFDNSTSEYNPMQYVKGVFVSDTPITNLSP